MMNALILGNNKINAEAARVLAESGVGAEVLTDVSEILKFSGEPGGYTVVTQDGTARFTSVIVTEPPRYAAVEADGGTSVCLADEAETERLFDPKRRDKILILLDFAEETPEYLAAKAVRLAARLAKDKKDVVFLSKTVKSGYGDGELCDREARNAGVQFVKYEKASVRYDAGEDIFCVEANDGVFEISLRSPFLVTAGFEESGQLKRIAKKLRVRGSTKDGINDDRFFLYSAFTLRRGIYYLNPALTAGDEKQRVKEALQPLMEDMASIGADGYVREIIRGMEIPEVDPNKCAFCYSCYRACPHGALEPDGKASAMKVIEPLCQACAICEAICPAQAISRTGGGPAPAGGGKCKIYLCENGAAEAFDEILPSLGDRGRLIDSVRISCGGSVGAELLTGDFKDYETVIVACCVEDACRHMDGDKRACKQTGRVANLLNKAGLGGKHAHVIHTSLAMKDVMKEQLTHILEESN
ncbi:MAG: hydrogenase iron-sulfur subunit [Clostridiales bacterium]|nr:hydrogenase iron-sulfur subunit [Clostridiales bacterium]